LRLTAVFDLPGICTRTSGRQTGLFTFNALLTF